MDLVSIPIGFVIFSSRIGRLSAAAGSPFFLKLSAGRDVEMKLGDVRCVRISFAINSNPFSADSD